ncbi:MAG: DUF2145 domain-containing protein [Lysobacteraceae bacterium]
MSKAIPAPCASPEHCERKRSTRIAGALIALMLVTLVALLLCISPKARAGTDCEARAMAPDHSARAAATALTVVAALDEIDAPVAMVSRAGTDLSKHGLHYSHAGFAVRDHPDGRWTVVHLLNDCSGDGSGLYTQGLVNFFADDLVNQDARITWLQPEIAERLSKRLLAMPGDPLYTPHYNLIARPDSARYQNSTSWVLEHIAAAIPSKGDVRTRIQAYQLALGHGFQPGHIHIPYTKRIVGGLFAANLVFTDHSVATRLGGDYPVVTVRSILDWLQHSDIATREREWRHGRSMSLPGPG